MKDHKGFARLGPNYAHYNYPLYRWIRKVGFENLEFVILEECTSADLLNEAETRWITELGTYGNGGLNCDRGGGCHHRGIPLSPEHRAKISASLKGRVFSDETRKKISDKKRGENHHFYGKTLPPEFGAKISSVTTGSLNPNAKLDEEKVQAILLRLSGGEGYGTIAADYSVGNHVIGYIARGMTWKHVERPA